jgi:hypothetical protein
MPRASLDSRLSRLSTFKVLLTKHTEEDLWNHFTSNIEKYKQYYWETEATLTRALQDVRQSNPYTNRDAWRKFQRDCRKIPLRYEHTWWYYARTEDDESKSDLHFWFMRFVKDIEVCDLVFGWSNSKEEYNNLHYDLDRMRSDILQMEKEVVETDKDMYDTAYNTWKTEDAEWIADYRMRKNHGDHKPRWEHQQRCLRDPEEKEWYDRMGGEPLHLKQCPLCLASPNHQRTLEEKKKLEEEEAEQERQDEERRKEADRIAREEERQKRLAEYKTRPPPTKYECEVCETTIYGDSAWDLHTNSKEHIQNEKHKSWYCETCKFQGRHKVEYTHHITTKKHLELTGERTTRNTEAFACEPCGYSCYLKQHLDQHCKSKKHIAKVSQKNSE